jgi:hypothetical protein
MKRHGCTPDRARSAASKPIRSVSLSVRDCCVESRLASRKPPGSMAWPLTLGLMGLGQRPGSESPFDIIMARYRGRLKGGFTLLLHRQRNRGDNAWFGCDNGFWHCGNGGPYQPEASARAVPTETSLTLRVRMASTDADASRALSRASARIRWRTPCGCQPSS